MAVSYGGQMLSQWGQALPTLLNQRKNDSIALVQQQRNNSIQDEDRKIAKEKADKQAVLDEIIKGIEQRKLETANYESDMRKTGDQKLDEFESSKRISTLPISPEYALQPPKLASDSPALPTTFNPPKYELAQPGMSDLARANKFSLRRNAMSGSSVERVLKRIDEENKPVDKNDGKQPFNLVGARIKYDTPEYRATVTEAVNDALTRNAITSAEANFARKQIDAGFAYDYGQSFRETGVESTLKRGVKVADEFALITPRAQTTYEKEMSGREAGRDAPVKLGQNEIDPNSGKPFTIDQHKGALAYFAISDANKTIDRLLAQNKDYNESDIDKAILSTINKDGNLRLQALNSIKNPQVQQYAQAKLNFIISKLRNDSGAAIGADEYRMESQRNFPMMGASPEVKEQFRNTRLNEESMKYSQAGDAIIEYYKNNKDSLKKERVSPYKKAEPAPITSPTKASSSFDDLWSKHGGK